MNQLELEKMFAGGNQPDVTAERKKTPPRFSLLTPVETERECELVITDSPLAMKQWISTWCSRDSLVAFDVETKGLEPWLPDTKVVGFSLATGGSSCYLDCSSFGFDFPPVRHLFELLITRKCRLLAHNWFFDGHWLLDSHPDQYERLKVESCTYLVYKLLATEGWDGQSWGLKDAQTSLLGWQDTNERELDEWLVGNGWVGQNASKKFTEEMTSRQRIRHYYSEDNLDKNGRKKVKPSKGEMWRAPRDILGKYCCLDSHSTWLLYTEVLHPVVNKYRELPEYINAYMELLDLLIRQQQRGIEIQEERLAEVVKQWEKKCEDALTAFLEHSEVSKYAKEWFDRKFKEEYLDKEPERYKKPPKKPKEPKMYKKDGSYSKVYLSYIEDRLPRWEHAVANPEQSKNWERWVERRQKMVEECTLNLNSGDQLCWLFYERLGYPVAKYTDSGEPSIDKKVVGLLGEPGKLLRDYGIVDKERSYMQSCLDKQYQGVLHPGFRVPGTLTGRLAGAGGFNAQQQPKVQEYLECFTARKGYKWVQCDVTSLEKVVLAELSKDPALWSLYGPGAKLSYPKQYILDKLDDKGINYSIDDNGDVLIDE